MARNQIPLQLWVRGLAMDAGGDDEPLQGASRDLLVSGCSSCLVYTCIYGRQLGIID